MLQDQGVVSRNFARIMAGPTVLGDCQMLRSTNEMGRLYLTSDLWPNEARAAREHPAGEAALFGGHFNRFPPVDDVVSDLDRIASRTLAA